MSEKYQSIIRSFTTRNMYEAALTVGSDIVIPQAPASGGHYIEDLPFYANKETNFIVRRVGVFSNFADGLVLKIPADRIDVLLDYYGFIRQPAGSVFSLDFTYGSKAVTAIAGTPGWINGASYSVEVTNANPLLPSKIVNIVATGPAAGNLQDYWYGVSTPLGRDAYNLYLLASGSRIEVVNVSLLNCMYEVNDFGEPFVFAAGQPLDMVGIWVKLNAPSMPGGPHTTTFMTHTIAPAFDRSTVYFDVITEIEFTKNP